MTKIAQSVRPGITGILVSSKPHQDFRDAVIPNRIDRFSDEPIPKAEDLGPHLDDDVRIALSWTHEMIVLNTT